MRFWICYFYLVPFWPQGWCIIRHTHTYYATLITWKFGTCYKLFPFISTILRSQNEFDKIVTVVFNFPLVLIFVTILTIYQWTLAGLVAYQDTSSNNVSGNESKRTKRTQCCTIYFLIHCASFCRKNHLIEVPNYLWKIFMKPCNSFCSYTLLRFTHLIFRALVRDKNLDGILFTELLASLTSLPVDGPNFLIQMIACAEVQFLWFYSLLSLPCENPFFLCECHFIK